jgi:hypothetical protein
MSTTGVTARKIAFRRNLASRNGNSSESVAVHPRVITGQWLQLEVANDILVPNMEVLPKLGETSRENCEDILAGGYSDYSVITALRSHR